MKIAQKIESITGRRDSLARRVLNVAPDTVANITAEELARGVTLESLERVNVPVLRYDTQVTIHGKVTGAASSKFCTVNGNGSIGVRYAAIDAEKKRRIALAVRLGKTGWHANIDSQGLTISRCFAVTDENKREQAKVDCLAAMRSVPTSLFYGWAGAFSLAYGAGYAVQVSIGAIPEGNVADLMLFFSGFASLQDMESAEAAEIAKIEVERAERDARWEREAAERKVEAEKTAAEFAAFMETVNLPKLTSIKRAPGKFCFYSRERDASGAFILKTVEIAKRGPLLCYKVTPAPTFADKFRKVEDRKWKAWDAAAQSGRVYKAEHAIA